MWWSHPVKLTDHRHLRTYWALDLAGLGHLLMVILSLFCSVSQVSVYSGSEPSGFSGWTCRGNLASFLSDKKRGSILHIIGSPPMSYLKDSSENSRFGPDSRTSGNRVSLTAWVLCTHICLSNSRGFSFSIFVVGTVNSKNQVYVYSLQSKFIYTRLIIWYNYTKLIIYNCSSYFRELMISTSI